MKAVDFDIEKDPLGQAVPLRICPGSRGLALRIQQGGQNQQDLYHKAARPGRGDTDPSVGACSANLLVIDRYPIARSDC
jgi:hypothetical protein